MQLKRPEEYTERLEDVLCPGLHAADPDQVVTLVHNQRVHLCKISWGWKPNFQATPSNMPFDEQVEANSVYTIRSVKDIRDYYRTGDYIIIDEYGEEHSWDDFKNDVLEWEERQREVREKNDYPPFEAKSHIGLDGMHTYADDEGYEFSTTCFC